MQESDTDLDGFSIWEIINNLKNRWQLIITGVVLGLSSAFVFLFLVPAKFEALAVVQPAKLAFSTSAVEPISQTIERFKLPSFYTRDDITVCRAKSELDLTQDVKVVQIKGNNLLSISYRANSPEIAEACVNLIVSKLQKSQSAIYEPLIKEFYDQMILVKKRIDDVEQFLTLETKRVSSLPRSDDFSAFLYLKRDELVRLQTLYNEKRIQFTEPLTQPVRLLSEITVPEKPVFPNKLLISALGLVLGFFLGLVAVLINFSWQKHRATHAHLGRNGNRPQ